MYLPALSPMLFTMLEIGLRPQKKKELTNRISHLTKLFKCDLLILSLYEISDRFLTSGHRTLEEYQTTG